MLPPPAPAYLQANPAYHSRFAVGQKKRRVGNVVRPGRAGQPSGWVGALCLFYLLHLRFHHRCISQSRGNTVYPDVIGNKFGCQHFSEGDYHSFRTRICRIPSRRIHCRHRSGIDDRTQQLTITLIINLTKREIPSSFKLAE